MHRGYAAVSYPGCWWEVPPLGLVHPIDVNYYPYTLLTSNIKRNSQALQTTVIGGVDASTGPETWTVSETQRVWATAFQSPQGPISLIVVNDSYESKALQIDLGRPDVEINKAFVTAQACNQIHQGRLTMIPGQYGIFADTLPPRSIIVYSEILSSDFDHDCNINLIDFEIFGEQWMQCNNPTDPECLPTW